jgi:hypothetical protein
VSKQDVNSIPVLNPKEKMAYFKKHWSTELQDDVIECVEEVVRHACLFTFCGLICVSQFKERYLSLSSGSTTTQSAQPKPHKKLNVLLRELSDDEEITTEAGTGVPEDPKRPWLTDFRKYLDVVEQVPDDYSAIGWWGVSDCNFVYHAALLSVLCLSRAICGMYIWFIATGNPDLRLSVMLTSGEVLHADVIIGADGVTVWQSKADTTFQLNSQRYHPAWSSLARDYLAIMSSSVSSERAFSQGGITISKLRSCLKGDIVEALQCIKCAIRTDLLFPAPAPSSVVEAEANEDGEDTLPENEDGEVFDIDEEGWDDLLIEDGDDDEPVAQMDTDSE